MYKRQDYYSFKDGGNFFVQANFKADKKEEALKLIKDEIQKILNKDMTQKEFEKAKKKLKVRFAQGAETVSEIAESIGYYMTVCDDLDLAESYLNDLENYTLEEANKTAQKYLQLQNSVTTVLLPE